MEDYRIGIPYAGHWSLVFNGDADVYGEKLDGTDMEGFDTENLPYDGYEQSARINLGAYSCLIFVRSK